MGTPFDRCVKLFDDAKEDCQRKMGAMKFLCEVSTVVESVCYSIKFMDFVCELIDFVSDSAIGYVKESKFDKNLLKKYVQSFGFYRTDCI